jgi:hypothetical protein
VADPVLEYFLSSKRDDVALELLEVSHSAFTKTYRIVRNATDGVTVTLETGATAEFEYYPATITELGSMSDLDSGIRIDFGDLGEVIPKEVDSVHAADAMDVKPVVTYRVYRSDDLTAPLIGPVDLVASTFSFKREGASFEAAAPYVNRNRTGQTYNLTRFPMLRGFLQ